MSTAVRARTTDPSTSHEAAASVSNITETQRYILKSLQRPAHDVELIDRYRRMSKAPIASESGIRSRRNELVERGAVIDSGMRALLPSGRSAIVWALNHNSPVVQEVI